MLGPNGAGKTTAISMLSTVLLSTEGEIRIDGKKLTRKSSAQKRKLSVFALMLSFLAKSYSGAPRFTA